MTKVFLVNPFLSEIGDMDECHIDHLFSQRYNLNKSS